MDIWKRIEEDEIKIYKAKKLLNGENDLDILNSIYYHIKEVSNDYYNGKYMHPDYYIIRDSLYYLEKHVQGNLIDISSIFSFNYKSQNFIDFLVWEGRRHLICKHYSNFNKSKEDINLNIFNFTNLCKESSKYIKKVCDKYKIKNFLIPIYPGFTNQYNLYNGSGFHYINIIYYNSKYYLIDLTYSQFFYKNKSSLERIGIVDVSSSNVGRFMMLNDASKNIALEMLKNGYIELTEEIFKRYLDGFALSFRNGLYYENTNDFSFKTNYSIENYLKFLYGYDNQVNHEGLENLGYQKRPLKKNISFGGKHE